MPTLNLEAAHLQSQKSPAKSTGRVATLEFVDTPLPSLLENGPANHQIDSLAPSQKASQRFSNRESSIELGCSGVVSNRVLFPFHLNGAWFSSERVFDVRLEAAFAQIKLLDLIDRVVEH